MVENSNSSQYNYYYQNQHQRERNQCLAIVCQSRNTHIRQQLLTEKRKKSKTKYTRRENEQKKSSYIRQQYTYRQHTNDGEQVG